MKCCIPHKKREYELVHLCNDLFMFIPHIVLFEHVNKTNSDKLHSIKNEAKVHYVSQLYCVNLVILINFKGH